MASDYQDTVIFGDCRGAMRGLIDAGVTVQTCITSPPYWRLRDYGADGQLGRESTPQEYVENIVDCMRLVRDLLADDGTLWLNLGDSYISRATTSFDPSKSALSGSRRSQNSAMGNCDKVGAGIPTKNLVGIPWRVALALQDDGWILRCDIVWEKMNTIPQSATDRPTRNHEYIFLLSKNPRYHYDADAIKEPCDPSNHRERVGFKPAAPGQLEHSGFQHGRMYEMRNKRAIWRYSTQPYTGAHFAVFPPKLIEPCILAGSRIGDTVLDPFFGSGTTGKVAKALGRHWIGCELNEEFGKLHADRIGSQEVLPA